MTAQMPPNSKIELPFFDKKTGTTALVGVLALHGIVAVGLANMTIPEIKPPKVTPPLEIAFIQPPPPVEVKPEEIKIESKPIEKPIEPKLRLVLPPKHEPKKTETKIEKQIDPKPIAKPLVKPVEKPVPKTVEKPIQEPAKAPVKETEKPVVKQSKPDQNLIKSKQLAEENERAEQQRQKGLEQEKLRQQQQAEQQRQQDLIKQQERDRKQAEADAERKRADEEAKRKAKADADAKAKKEADDRAQKAKDDAQKAAQNNTPVTFSAGQASWRNKPDFNCGANTSGDILTASFRYTVDKQGNASVLQSKATGNAKVDRQLLMQAKTGKFNSFTKGGIPVVGIVTLHVRCQ